jgi:hypothetical protein
VGFEVPGEYTASRVRPIRKHHHLLTKLETLTTVCIAGTEKIISVHVSRIDISRRTINVDILEFNRLSDPLLFFR